MSDLSGGGWSDSICFYPDGTTSDVRLVLLNDRGNRVELTLRGLTGTVIVGDVQAPEERLPCNARHAVFRSWK